MAHRWGTCRTVRDQNLCGDCEGTFHYLDLSSGVALKSTHDVEQVIQNQCLYLGRDLSDRQIVAILRGE
jgi:hypothetical protein